MKDISVDECVSPIVVIDAKSDNPSIANGSSEKLKAIDGGEQQVVVACRIRPLTEEEIIQGASLISHKIAEDNMIVLMDPSEDPDDILRANRSRERQFIFDMVFDAKSTQQDVYEKTTKPLLSGVLNGYNATVFAYGATGAGKTYTMLGTQEEPGIMFRTLHDLFIDISKTSKHLLYQVSMSYLEIYNELIRDLLNPSSGFLELREDAKGGVQVAGISEKVADTPEEVMLMLHKGNKERTQEPTKANKTSSRSHAVLQVNIKQRNKTRSHTQEVRLGKLYMIDLAGSERAAHTQNTGKRMVEGAHINRSLLALGNCINALSEKSSTKYVNYRDSKLTRILKDSLGGNSKTVMIAHVSPASLHFEESRNTLVYADRAKYIRTKLRRNVIDVSYHISQYQQIIQELAQEIAMLKEQRSDLETKVSHLDPRNGFGNADDRQKLEEAFKLRESLVHSFKEQLKLRVNILELDNSTKDLSMELDRHTRFIDKHDSYKENNQTTLKLEDQRALLNAKQELKVVEHDREELESKRRVALKEYESLKTKIIKLREQIAKKLNTKEQKEILNLLCKNFEFEMKNLEKQAEIFQRDHIIRDKDLIILRLEQHRSLCDTLIYQQRKLIQDHHLDIPADLNELFYLYSRDVNEGQLMRDITGITQQSKTQHFNVASPSTITFLTQIQEEDVSGSPQTEPNRINDLVPLFPSPWSKRSLAQALDNDNQDKVFYKTKKASLINKHKNINKEMNNNSKSNAQAIPHLSFNKHSKTSRNNMSMLSSSTNDSNIEISVEQQASNQQSTSHAINTSTQSKSKIKNKHTQGIAAVAAQRKATQHHRDLMQELGQQTSSLGSNSTATEIDTKLTTSRLAKHDQLLNILNNTNNTLLNNKNLDDTLSEKKSTILTDGSNKMRKQVRNQDKVTFQVPEELDQFGDKLFVRRNSMDSPNLIKLNEDADASFSSFKGKSKEKSSKRSKSINPPEIYTNSTKTSKPSFISNNSTSTINANTRSNNQANKVPPSIPNYSKGQNFSISGTSVLKL